MKIKPLNVKNGSCGSLMLGMVGIQITAPTRSNRTSYHNSFNLLWELHKKFVR